MVKKWRGGEKQIGGTGCHSTLLVLVAHHSPLTTTSTSAKFQERCSAAARHISGASGKNCETRLVKRLQHHWCCTRRVVLSTAAISLVQAAKMVKRLPLNIGGSSSSKFQESCTVAAISPPSHSYYAGKICGGSLWRAAGLAAHQR